MKPVLSDDERLRVGKLPGWAQDLIDNLTLRIEDAYDRETARDTGETRVRVSTVLRDEGFSLDDRSIVRFDLGPPAGRNAIEVRLDDDGLSVRTTGGALAVRPSASNSIIVRSADW